MVDWTDLFSQFWPIIDIRVDECPDRGLYRYWHFFLIVEIPIDVIASHMSIFSSGVDGSVLVECLPTTRSMN